MTYINENKKGLHHLCSIKRKENIKEVVSSIERAFILILLTISLLTSWNNETYRTVNSFEFIDEEENHSSILYNEIALITEKEENLDANTIDTSLGLASFPIAYLKLQFLAFHARLLNVLFNKVKIYLLYCKLQIDY